jgi:hypothetical protein
MGSVIYHPDLIFEENLDLKSEISNFVSGTCCGHICVSATFQKNVTSTNQDDLYIILTQFLRRIQICSQKFQIQSIASIFGMLLF